MHVTGRRGRSPVTDAGGLGGGTRAPALGTLAMPILPAAGPKLPGREAEPCRWPSRSRY